MLDWIMAPWPWWFSGILVGLTVPLLFILSGKAFGISTSFQQIGAMCTPGSNATYFVGGLAVTSLPEKLPRQSRRLHHRTLSPAKLCQASRPSLHCPPLPISVHHEGTSSMSTTTKHTVWPTPSTADWPTTHHRVVVVGGGTAGISVAARLCRG